MSWKVKDLVESQFFVVFIVGLILLNSAVLATEHYNQPEWLTESQNIANVVFTILFALEMILSMIGLGIKGYFSDNFNKFDSIIVVISIVDLILTYTSDSGESPSSGITVLRSFRLLRIFKLVKSWTTLQHLLKTIIESMSSISNLAILSFLFLFVYSLIGKQFFWGIMYDEDGEETRYVFGTTTDALITMFCVLTGENWNEIMSIVVLNHESKQYLAIFFFVTAVLIGNFMLLNLFLAILLKFLQDAVDNAASAESSKLEKKQM